MLEAVELDLPVSMTYVPGMVSSGIIPVGPFAEIERHFVTKGLSTSRTSIIRTAALHAVWESTHLNDDLFHIRLPKKKPQMTYSSQRARRVLATSTLRRGHAVTG